MAARVDDPDHGKAAAVILDLVSVVTQRTSSAYGRALAQLALTDLSVPRAG
jgi:hypothetical protein